MKNNAIRMEVKYILHFGNAVILHSTFYSPLPLERGWG